MTIRKHWQSGKRQQDGVPPFVTPPEPFKQSTNKDNQREPVKIRDKCGAGECDICPLARREAPTAGRRPADEGANIDRRLVLTREMQCELRTKSRIEFIYPLARREAPAEGRRPEGEGANIDRRLVLYHGKSMRIQSHIEFIYIYIYASTTVLFATACEGWVLGETFEESNNKSTESWKQLDRNRIQRDEKKVEYSKAWVNETWVRRK